MIFNATLISRQPLVPPFVCFIIIIIFFSINCSRISFLFFNFPISTLPHFHIQCTACQFNEPPFFYSKKKKQSIYKYINYVYIFNPIPLLTLYLFFSFFFNNLPPFLFLLHIQHKSKTEKGQVKKTISNK